MGLKAQIKPVFKYLGIDLTRNMRYDRLSERILKTHLTPASNCIDVGSHKGEFLVQFLKYAPQGTHFAFEPIPDLFQQLEESFGGKARIFPYALAAAQGESSFQYVVNAPAYSGLKQRRYDIKSPEIKEIKVALHRLDDILPSYLQIDFVKIDVEGAEMGVLKGGLHTIAKWKPLVLFEFGKGASDYYGTQPAELYDLLTREAGLQVFSLAHYLHKKPAYSRADFIQCYENICEYYFIAAASSA